MSVYLIVEAKEITDPRKYQEYIQKVPVTIQKFGGRYLVRGGQATPVSGNWHPSRLIIVEFGSMDRFQAWWHSSEYRAVAPLREQSGTVDAVVVEGI